METTIITATAVWGLQFDPKRDVVTDFPEAEHLDFETFKENLSTLREDEAMTTEATDEQIQELIANGWSFEGEYK